MVGRSSVLSNGLELRTSEGVAADQAKILLLCGHVEFDLKLASYRIEAEGRSRDLRSKIRQLGARLLMRCCTNDGPQYATVGQ